MRATLGISQILSFEQYASIMKAFIVVLALVAAVAAEDWVPKKFEEIKAIRAECLAENTIAAEDLEKMKLFVYPDVEPVRNYILCNAKKIGVFCEHEGYHVDRVVKQFKLKMDEAEATGIAEKCADKNVEKSSADVWAYRGHKCLVESKLGEGIKDFVRRQLEAAKV